ncbi:DUF5107 domain-containing protein [Knoellia sp. Soil729]|uniref:DUF5107 domain-containing protein n=1 Tax=Knoellia sp. Soil729 TaxID=1736394 RepID=UPI0006F2940B|nr:DUF5107 domain-containing protein [Knoellia sp. Soil729]KRE42711.1 hypothetical protein ASG74_10060 [Knoellia sp. Soil729]
MAHGRLSSPLPYGVVSDYDRCDRHLELPAIELSNEHLSATILPSHGGRVWSLQAQEDGRDLVHRNARLRWANFGLTDAWFAGGIEWNLGSTGHSAMSNLPMHSAILDTPLGPVVRLWEWERTRDLVLQVDLWLSGARLMASTRVLNPDPEPKPLYYWTNVAVPETAGTRVLVPADSAWRTDYEGTLERVPVPFPDGSVDVSVPSASRYAADYFFEVAHQQGRLVCAVEPDGHGLAQTSTDALHGRKLFLWGNGPGGQRWQDWLGEPGSRYLEIQAGVCPTQLEHDVLDASAERTWTEAFLPLDLDPGVVGADYETATLAARTSVHEAASPQWLAEVHEQWRREVADLAPGELVATGSGWGRAELALRGADQPLAMPFPEVEDESRPLLQLALSGNRSGLDDLPADSPLLPVISDRWTAALAACEDAEGADGSGSRDPSPRGPGSRGPGWWVPYALATARHLKGDREGARAAYRTSCERHPNAGSLRGLALLAEHPAERAELYRQAFALAPDDRRLAVELLTSGREAGHPDEVVATVGDLPEAVRSHGRIQLLLAQALASLGEDDAALQVLTDLEVPDLAEGDQALSDLWTQLRPGEPVPARLDFRMAVTPQ